MTIRQRLKQARQQQLTGEAVRFAIVGTIATVTHYAVYLLLLPLISKTPAYTIGYALSFILNYTLSARYTFRRKQSARNGIGFAAAHAFNYLLHIVLLNVFTYIGIKAALAPIPVYCIAIPVNFIMVRLVFKKL